MNDLNRGVVFSQESLLMSNKNKSEPRKGETLTRTETIDMGRMRKSQKSAVTQNETGKRFVHRVERGKQRLV